MLLATVWMAKPRTTTLNENGGTIVKDSDDCDAYRLQGETSNNGDRRICATQKKMKTMRSDLCGRGGVRTDFGKRGGVKSEIRKKRSTYPKYFPGGGTHTRAAKHNWKATAYMDGRKDIVNVRPHPRALATSMGYQAAAGGSVQLCM